jgi:hypothetical protein
VRKERVKSAKKMMNEGREKCVRVGRKRVKIKKVKG